MSGVASGVLRAEGVSVRAPGSRAEVLHGVDVAVAPGDGVGLVGRSGAGKSTLVRALLGLQAPSAGRVTFAGAPLARRGPALRDFRRSVQYVPQDPVASLDPRHSVERLVREPLRALRIEGDHDRRTDDALRAVDLDPSLRTRRVAEISGGQAQRVAVARALATGAAVLVADEPLSALDRPLQRELASLLLELREQRGVGLLLVSHDLATVERTCLDVVVLDDGRVVERGPVGALLRDPQAEATRALVGASLGAAG